MSQATRYMVADDSYGWPDVGSAVTQAEYPQVGFDSGGVGSPGLPLKHLSGRY